jgi:hypothetical protein
MYLNDPIFNIVDSVGAPISGAKAYFYLTGTTTLVNTYTTVGRTVANTNPVIADSAGRFPPIYLDPDITYRMQLKDASDILIADRDPIAGEGGEVFQYVHRTIATAGQTAFTLPITYTVGASALTVYVNGLRVEQGAGLDYVETNNTTITFTSGLAAGDLVVVAIYRNVDAAATPPNYTVESIAALRLLTTATAATQLFLLYNYVAGDGGGAFRYDSTDTTTADNGGTVIVDAAGRRWKRQYDGAVNVTWWGADPTGAVNCVTAFAAALTAVTASKEAVYAPAGTYLLSSQITVPSGVEFFGDGIYSTILTSNSATNGIILVPAGALGTTLRDFQVTRSVAATNTTASGVEFSRTGNGVEHCTAMRILAQNQYEGFVFGPCAYGLSSELISQNNYSHGALQIASSTSGLLQWQHMHFLSQKNDGRSFFIDGRTYSGSITVGEIHQLKTFANTLGMLVLGDANSSVNGVRLDLCFFGEDNGDLLTLDTFSGSEHSINDCQFELAGRSSTGRTLTTPATNDGAGINITATNSGTVQIECCSAFNNSHQGIVSAARVHVLGGNYVDNGLDTGLTATSRCGLEATAGARVVGGLFKSTSSVKQQYGIVWSASTDVQLIGVDLVGNNVAPTNGTFGTTTVIVGAQTSIGNRLSAALGIGTSGAPAARLHIDGTGNVGARIDNNFNRWGIFVRDTSGNLGFFDDTGGAYRAQFVLANSRFDLASGWKYSINGVDLLVGQGAAIADLTVTATTGSLPTPDGSVTIANAATPTVTELLDFCVELEAKVETILARMRASTPSIAT